MPIERDFAEIMHDTITLEPWVSDDTYGKPVYGQPITYTCHVENSNHLRRQTEESVGVTFSEIWLSVSVTVDKRDRLTLADGTQPLIVSVNYAPDDMGPYATSIFTFYKRGA